ncbi:DUF2931 family protein [Aquimarina aquimarini]|uniref:DUF2931 family protein n=1 Tax=Aquimarina aquimarini TaxID=1191734 RepID=UPI000D54FD93|nr:DUF2931 family protein [Aquimarina aquimarini]
MVNNLQRLRAVFLVLVITLTTISVVSCQDNNPKKEKITNAIGMKKYEWRPSACAPKFSPVQIHKGSFIYENEESIYIPSGHTLDQGWGKLGATHIVGDDSKPIPVKLEITWLSYLEKKFYKGSFDLPSKKIETLFAEGYMDRLGQKKTYSRINVGLAPGGIVVVWLMGNGWSTEVDRFVASETEVTIQEFAPSAMMTIEEFIDDTLEEDFDEETKSKMNPEQIPYGIWDTYRKKYNWKPVVMYQEPDDLKEILIDFVNGESLNTIGDNPVLGQNKEWPIADYFRLKWKDKNNNDYGAKIFFDYRETQEAFEKVYQNPKAKEVELILKIDKYNSDIELSVKSDSEVIMLEKARVKIYETSN